MHDDQVLLSLLASPSKVVTISTACKALCDHRECKVAREEAGRRCPYCRQRLGFGAKITEYPPAHLSCTRLAAPARTSSAVPASLKGGGPAESGDLSSAAPEVNGVRPRPNRCVSVGRLDDGAQALSDSNRAWEAFRNDEELKRAYSVSGEEIDMLSQVTLMGEVRNPRDFVYILNVLRMVLKR